MTAHSGAPRWPWRAPCWGTCRPRFVLRRGACGRRQGGGHRADVRRGDGACRGPAAAHRHRDPLLWPLQSRHQRSNESGGRRWGLSGQALAEAGGNGGRRRHVWRKVSGARAEVAAAAGMISLSHPSRHPRRISFFSLRVLLAIVLLPVFPPLVLVPCHTSFYFSTHTHTGPH